MRIQPVLSRYTNYNKTLKKQTLFESKNNPFGYRTHSYTGIASVDLAYASMFDNSIAKDLKMMGLI